MNEKLIALYASTIAFITTKRDEEKGATAVEYALLVVLIAVFIIGGVAAFGGWLDDTFDEIGGLIDAGTGS